MKKLLIFCLMLALVMPFGFARAEGGFDLTAVQSLLDTTAAAALRAGEKPETIQEKTPLSSAFVRAFVLAAIKNGQADAKAAEDVAAQEALLTSCFEAKLPKLETILLDASLPPYIGFQVLEVETDGDLIRLTGMLYEAADQINRLVSEQLDQITWREGTASISLRKTDNGYRVVRFTASTDPAATPSTENYLTDTMAEYVNPTLGFSIQYPAVFTEDLLQETEAGVSAQLPDGSASFLVRRTENQDGQSIQQLMDAIKAKYPAAAVDVQAADGAGRAEYSDNGFRTVRKLFVAGSLVYEAELRYSDARAAEFDAFVNPMINSFNVDAVGVG